MNASNENETNGPLVVAVKLESNAPENATVVNPIAPADDEAAEDLIATMAVDAVAAQVAVDAHVEPTPIVDAAAGLNEPMVAEPLAPLDVPADIPPALTAFSPPLENVAAPPPLPPTHQPQNPNCVKDVAMSLVNLGRTSPVEGETSIPIPTFSPLVPGNTNNADSTKPEIDYLGPHQKPKNTYKMKPRDPKRDTSIPFSEMQRLMRVYGPIKCLRNRTPKNSEGLKQDSIKRKFYRWFPDFDSRFERTEEGWFKPRFGHEEEMEYRAEMRKRDQDELVKKRNCKRSKTRKAKEEVVQDAPMEVVAPIVEVAAPSEMVVAPIVEVAAPSEMVVAHTAEAAGLPVDI